MIHSGMDSGKGEVYEIPYISRKVANNIGGRLNTEDIARFAK